MLVSQNHMAIKNQKERALVYIKDHFKRIFKGKIK